MLLLISLHMLKVPFNADQPTFYVAHMSMSRNLTNGHHNTVEFVCSLVFVERMGMRNIVGNYSNAY